MATKVKQYRAKLKKEVYAQYVNFLGDKTEIIDRMADKYHVSVSTIYNYIREGKKQ